MASKRQDAEFRHPDTVAYLQGLTDEEAAKHSPIVRERDGVLTQQRRVGRRVRCREVEASGDPASGTGALDVLMRSAASEFGRSLPLLAAELRGGGVPDLDAIETLVRDGLLGCGTKGCAALLEAFDAHLVGRSPPVCPSCGRRMKRNRRIGKTLRTRLGEIRVKRTYVCCRACGGGHFPLDRALDLEGKSVTPGAEAIYADAASSDSCEEASRKLKNLAGVAVSKATLQRHGTRIGQEMQAFEREDVEAAAPTWGRTAGLKRSRPSFATAGPTETECATTSIGSSDCRSDPASWKAPASRSSAAASSGPGATGRRPGPTPCSPSNAASRTIVGPTSSNGGLAAPQPPDQKT